MSLIIAENSCNIPVDVLSTLLLSGKTPAATHQNWQDLLKKQSGVSPGVICLAESKIW